MQKKNIFRCWLTLLILLFLSWTVRSQDSDSSYIAKSGVDFQMPAGFHSEAFESEIDRAFDCGDGKLSNSLAYMIANSNNSVRIGISVVKILSPESTKWVKETFPLGYNPNENYSRSVRMRADTTKYPLIFFDDKSVLARYNADDGGLFMRNCNRPFLDRYRNHLILFIFKRDFGHVEITYFFNEEEKNKVDEMIKHAYDMIQFSKSR